MSVESVKQKRLEVKSKDEWSQYMASLTQEEIEWQLATTIPIDISMCQVPQCAAHRY